MVMLSLIAVPMVVAVTLIEDDRDEVAYHIVPIGFQEPVQMTWLDCNYKDGEKISASGVEKLFGKCIAR